MISPSCWWKAHHQRGRRRVARAQRAGAKALKPQVSNRVTPCYISVLPLSWCLVHNSVLYQPTRQVCKGAHAWMQTHPSLWLHNLSTSRHPVLHLSLPPVQLPLLPPLVPTTGFPSVSSPHIPPSSLLPLCRVPLFSYELLLSSSSSSLSIKWSYLLAHCRLLGRRFEPKDERVDPVMRILMPRNCLVLTRIHTGVQTHTRQLLKKVNFTVLLCSELGCMSNASYFEILQPRESWS